MRFGIPESDATSYAEDILRIVRDNWEKIASRYGLTRRQIEEMRPAFSVCYE
jgi:serine/threonine-protein kinase HipA